MKDNLHEFNEWLNSLTNFSLPKWRALPDLDLYMDQVVTYLERELAPLSNEDDEKMITTWMINNYVKGNLLNSPVQKKYSKEHIAYLLAICSIKQILSISDIAQLFDFQKSSERDSSVIYEFFRATQSEMIKNISKENIEKVGPLIEKGDNIQDSQANCYLYNLVFKLAIEAEVKKIIANKILSILTNADNKKEKSKLDYDKIEKEQAKKKK